MFLFNPIPPCVPSWIVCGTSCVRMWRMRVRNGGNGLRDCAVTSGGRDFLLPAEKWGSWGRKEPLVLEE